MAEIPRPSTGGQAKLGMTGGGGERSEVRSQETGDRGQESGDRGQETGDRGQGTGGRTTNHLSGHQPTTNNQQV